MSRTGLDGGIQPTAAWPTADTTTVPNNQRCRQDRACSPPKTRLCIPARAKIGIFGSEVPVAAAEAPPLCGLQLSAVDVEALFPSVSAAPRGRTPLENCAAAASKKDYRRRVKKSPPPPSPPGFARQALQRRQAERERGGGGAKGWQLTITCTTDCVLMTSNDHIWGR
jgi:hypothetical protein